jgi:hypothetical protein
MLHPDMKTNQIPRLIPGLPDVADPDRVLLKPKKSGKNCKNAGANANPRTGQESTRTGNPKVDERRGQIKSFDDKADKPVGMDAGASFGDFIEGLSETGSLPYHDDVSRVMPGLVFVWLSALPPTAVSSFPRLPEPCPWALIGWPGPRYRSLWAWGCKPWKSFPNCTSTSLIWRSAWPLSSN